MKITIDNFNYKGCHFDTFTCELPQVKNIDEIPEDRLTEYLIESLDEYLKFVDEES